MGNSGTAGRFLFHSRPRLLLFGAAHSNWYLVCYLILIDIAVFPCESEFLFTGQRDWVYRVRAKGPAIMTKDLRPWEWSLLALVVLLTAAGFTAYGVRATMSPWVIFGFVYAILNLGLLVVTLLVPSHAEEELRYTLRSFFIEGWFFIAAAFATSHDQYQIAGPAVVAGVLIHIFVTRKHARGLRQRRAGLHG